MNVTDLESMGLCKSVSTPTALKTLSAGAKALLLALLRAGDEGLPRAALKPFLKLDKDCLMEIEVKSLVHWLRDSKGRESHVCVNWKGQEAAEALRHVKQNQERSHWIGSPAEAKASENRRRPRPAPAPNPT
jgi:hypothetical protein